VSPRPPVKAETVKALCQADPAEFGQRHYSIALLGQAQLEPAFHALVANHDDLRLKGRGQDVVQPGGKFRGQRLHPVARKQIQPGLDLNVPCGLQN